MNQFGSYDTTQIRKEMNNIKLDLNKELDLKDIVEQEEKDVFLEVKNFVN